MRNPKGLTREQLDFFEKNGYIGPFTLFEPNEMKEIWDSVRLELLNKESAPFPNSKLNYDRHLDIKALSSIISSELLVEKISSILGDDLLCWRTEWFPKYPGDEGTAWHQAQSFVEFEGDPKLHPTKEVEGPWELTAWISFTHSTKSNGCMKVMPGTHKKWYFDETKNISHNPEKINKTEKEGKKSGFYGYDWDLLKNDPNWMPDENSAKHLEMNPGQFFIFTSRLLHASEPNTSKDSTRFGFATRFVPNFVRVYPDQKSFSHFGEEFDLKNYSAVQVKGKDMFNHNKISSPLT